MKSSRRRPHRPKGRRRGRSRKKLLPPSNSIEILNRQRRVSINRTQLKSAIQKVLLAEGVRHANLEIALVNDSAIRRVHNRFLQLDSPTDVLTFPLQEPGEPIAGAIVISAETAAREGPRHGLEPKIEILLYAIHGILHLCGYDDHFASDVRCMRRRQKTLLRQVSALI